MGKHSPRFKKAQRQRQKVKRKLNFKRTGSPKTVQSRDRNCTPVPERLTDQASTHCAELQTSDSEEVEALGVDLDVKEMKLADPYSDEFSYDYLFECRQRLMSKITVYRNEVESLRSNEVQLIRKCRATIERIRSFYKRIAFATTRTGKLIKTSMENGKPIEDNIETSVCYLPKCTSCTVL